MKYRVCLLAMLLANGASGPAGAQTIVRRVPASVNAAPLHRYFGLLERVNGTTLIIKRRNGLRLVVDASAAFTNNAVSAPLFAGKPTVVLGTIGADGTFHARIVKRAAPRVVTWDIDR